jgi:hypothetical protein
VKDPELQHISEELREIRNALKPAAATCTPAPVTCVQQPAGCTQSLASPTKPRDLISEIAIGLATVAVLGLGAVIMYLIFRKKDEPGFGVSLPANQDFSSQYISPEPLLLPAPPELPSAPEAPTVAPTVPVAPTPLVTEWHRVRERPMNQGVLKSYTLPSLATAGSEAVRLATAGDEATSVVVRTVSPMGSYAVLAFSAAELNTPGVGTTPTGDTLFVVVGDKQRVRLAPRQALFAKGSTAGVIVSVVSDSA